MSLCLMWCFFLNLLFSSDFFWFLGVSIVYPVCYSTIECFYFSYRLGCLWSYAMFEFLFLIRACLVSMCFDCFLWHSDVWCFSVGFALLRLWFHALIEKWHCISNCSGESIQKTGLHCAGGVSRPWHSACPCLRVGLLLRCACWSDLWAECASWPQLDGLYWSARWLP